VHLAGLGGAVSDDGAVREHGRRVPMTLLIDNDM
jgi:hypothetical protein